MQRTQIQSIYRPRRKGQHNLKSVDVRDSPQQTYGNHGPQQLRQVKPRIRHFIYAEGQRRYVESLSAYARQFLDRLEPPDVDSIEGLSPAISIEQKTATRSPRSTVGTVTEIYDYLRLLFSSIGIPHCHQCGKPIAKQTPDQIVRHLTLPEGERTIMILPPSCRDVKASLKHLQELAKSELRVHAASTAHFTIWMNRLSWIRKKNHSIEVVVDRLMIKKDIEKRQEASIEQATKLANGIVLVAIVEGEERLYSEKMACVDCDVSIPTIEPRTFSFNSMYGACEVCNGAWHEI